jgi:hypothetical protein
MIAHDALITAVRKDDNPQSHHLQERQLAHREIVNTPLFLFDIVNLVRFPVRNDLRL